MRTAASISVVAALVLATGLPVAHASSLDTTLIRRLLAGAAPAVARCAVAHHLPPGGYAVVITVQPGGATAVALGRTPALLTAPGAACVRAAFAAVRFPRFGTGQGEVRLTLPFVLR